VSRKRRSVSRKAVPPEPLELHPVLVDLEAKAQAGGLTAERCGAGEQGFPWLNVTMQQQPTTAPTMACFWTGSGLAILPSAHVSTSHPAVAWRQLSALAAVLADVAEVVFGSEGLEVHP
jgi:hypothetical protein